MRRILCAVVLVAAMAGCSSHKVVDSNGTTVTTNGTGDNQTVTVQASGGTMTAGKGAVDTGKLGLPIYPGATTDSNSSMSSTSAQGSGAVVALKTSDGFDKVYAWYKARMPANAQTMQSNSNGTSVGEFVEGDSTDKVQKSVTITSTADGTTITIVTATKN